MRTFLKSFKERQGGFTLVELMVVVAIIGLLSSVALPNFRKYQAKSKMSEAKLQLASLYTAESAFFSDFNIYATCLAYMGYDPQPEMPQRFFAIGFGVDAAINQTAWDAALNSGLQAGADVKDRCSRTQSGGAGPILNTAPGVQVSWYAAGKGTGNTIANTRAYMDWTIIGTQETNSNDPTVGTEAGSNTVTGMVYRAAAAGVIDGNYIANADGATGAALITIDNNKRVEVRRNGY